MAGAYVYNTDITFGAWNKIYSWRTNPNYNSRGKKPAKDCSSSVDAIDPFEFDIKYRVRTVKHRVWKTRPNGKRYYVVVYSKVPVPKLWYKKVSRTIAEWRLIIKAGDKILEAKPKGLPLDFRRRLMGLKQIMSHYPPCGSKFEPKIVRDPHNCTQETYEGGGLPEGPLMVVADATLSNRSYYDMAAYLLQSATFTGDPNPFCVTKPSGWSRRNTFRYNMSTRMMSQMTSNRSAILQRLWPNASDYLADGVHQPTPVVDVAEAIVDGSILGEPPSPDDARRLIDDVLMGDLRKETKLESFAAYASHLNKTINFAANYHLWRMLVVEPVMSTLVGLSASVAANDILIENIDKESKKGGWIQGKSWRLYGVDVFDCAAMGYDKYTSTASTDYTDTYTDTYTPKKFEGNAMLIYKPDPMVSVKANSSGMRLSLFFNELSASLDEVLYNLIPLSFVFDWFSSRYSGYLDLKSKIYMPLSQWALILSVKADIEAKRSHKFKGSRFYTGQYRLSDGAGPTDLKYMFKLTQIGVLPGYERRIIDEHKFDWSSDQFGRWQYYQRKVYLNLALNTTPLEISSSSFPCRSVMRSNPLNDGKDLTLGALIWAAFNK